MFRVTFIALGISALSLSGCALGDAIFASSSSQFGTVIHGGANVERTVVTDWNGDGDLDVMAVSSGQSIVFNSIGVTGLDDTSDAFTYIPGQIKGATVGTYFGGQQPVLAVLRAGEVEFLGRNTGKMPPCVVANAVAMDGGNIGGDPAQQDVAIITVNPPRLVIIPGNVAPGQICTGASNIDLSAPPVALAVADFTDDGTDDVVVALAGSGTFNFGSLVMFRGGSLPLAVANPNFAQANPGDSFGALAVGEFNDMPGKDIALAVVSTRENFIAVAANTNGMYSMLQGHYAPGLVAGALVAVATEEGPRKHLVAARVPGDSEGIAFLERTEQGSFEVTDIDENFDGQPRMLQAFDVDDDHRDDLVGPVAPVNDLVLVLAD